MVLSSMVARHWYRRACADGFGRGRVLGLRQCVMMLKARSIATASAQQTPAASRGLRNALTRMSLRNWSTSRTNSHQFHFLFFHHQSPPLDDILHGSKLYNMLEYSTGNTFTACFS